jgi:hypothetical protein
VERLVRKPGVRIRIRQTNGKQYYFTVKAVDAGGLSAASGEASATPAAPKSGGGAMDWLALVGLGALLVGRSRRAA